MKYRNIALVGTGASGISALRVLIRRGIRVAVFDGGMDVEESTLEKKQAIAALIRRGGIPDLIDPLDYSNLGTPRKSYFSSDFSQRPHSGFPIQTSNSVGMLPSFAIGGLTNVWGASTLRFRDEDLVSWPQAVKHLQPWYEQVLEWMPTVGPVTQSLHQNDFDHRRTTDSQIDRLLNRLTQHNSSDKRFFAARSSLAVSPQQDDCERCGLCLSGCPFDYIFSSRHEFDRLPTNMIQHYSGQVVTSLREDHDRVILYTDDGRGTESRFEFDAVFLGAGTIQSTALVMSALDKTEGVRIKDCQAFTLPMLSVHARTNPRRTMSLAQGILDLLDKDGSKSEAYIQIYPGGREIAFAADSVARRFHIPAVLRESLVKRSLAAHGFLPSSHSHELNLRVQQSRSGSIELVLVDSISNPVTQRALRHVIGRVSRIMVRAGVAVVSPMVHVELPGRSYHIGSSFPMHDRPTGFQSDVLGRPIGLRRTHVIDASVLPTMPPQSPTLTVMANATRIAATVEIE